jgi:hypothetical protein
MPYLSLPTILSRGSSHRDDHAVRVEMAPDSRLTDLGAALSRIFYAHGNWSRQRATALRD